MKNQRQYTDLTMFFGEKLYKLSEDMEWRCKEARLQQSDFTTIVAMGSLWQAAQALAYGTKKTGDEKFVKIFRVFLDQARKNAD